MRADRIAHLYADPGPFASAYVELSRDAQDGDHIAELQIRAACDQLTEQGAPEPVVEQVREQLSETTHLPAPVSRCVVVTDSGVLLKEQTRRRRSQPFGVWDALPDISDWIADEDSMVPFVLALADHEGGDVRSYLSDPFNPDDESTVGGETEFEHKIRGGGWAHLRYQHHTENVWRRNAAEVAEEIETQVARGAQLVLLAGDPKSCQQVQALLGDVRADVVHLGTGGRSADGGDDALEAAVSEALYGKVVSNKLAEVHELKARLGRDDSVAIGVGDVVDALVLGKVDRLLIDPAAAANFEVQPGKHPGLALGAASGLPSTIPADRALVAAAAMTNADIVVTRSSTLGGAPAAGLLRWN
ncbi:MAG TPA: Vms1/Ankzf1 family peptidyl-tRNA hydrolase [Propionibacteriaceae bacterium]